MGKPPRTAAWPPPPGLAAVVAAPAAHPGRTSEEEGAVRSFEVEETVVRRDVHRSGGVE
ncbi:hypothetical protein [Streptomyces sp. NPDC002994]|uniref:hypothetical protein n=1 Tax=Streptomyces sp. NPDC002994 TaxID=3154441 RepID=UPI0033A0F875